LHVQRQRYRKYFEANTDKYGVIVLISLVSLGWQLKTAIPAAADQTPVPAGQQQPAVTVEKASDEPAGDDDGDDAADGGAINATEALDGTTVTTKKATSAVTPDNTVDAVAIARTVAQATLPKSQGPVPTSRQTTRMTAVPTAAEPVGADTVADTTGEPASTAPAPYQFPVASYTHETIDQWMPNRILQHAVWLALRDTSQTDGKTWATQQEITQQDMRRLQRLYVTGNAESHGISSYIDGKTEFSLKGLAYAVNLEKLSLGGGHIQNEPFQVYGDVVDISPLAYLPKLEYAALDNNRIADISPLRHLQQLDRLYLTFNHIADFSPLEGHEFRQLTVTRQLVTLPTIAVDAQTRRAQMASPYIQPNGPWAVAGLGTTPANYLRQNISFQLTETGHLWNFVEYHTMPGTDIDMGETDDDWGTLYFKNIPDQLPGDYGGLEDNQAHHQIALPDYYYLMGEAYPDTDEFKTTDGDIEWYVVQPYTIIQKAGAVTVHYQDQTGQTLAPDRTLPQGNVGDAYDTSQLVAAIKGYTLTTPPDNAAGKYTANPISVTYVYRKNPVKPDATRPPVPGVTPPVEVIPPTSVVPPTEPIFPGSPVPVTPPTATGPTDVNQPPVTVAPTSEMPSAGTESAVTPTMPVTHAEIGDLLTKTPQRPRRKAIPGHGTALQQAATYHKAGGHRKLTSRQPTLPQTDERRVWAWWGMALLLITVVNGWLGKRRWMRLLKKQK
jgi:hypothetical protein